MKILIFFARQQNFLYEDGINEVKIKLKKYRTKNWSLNQSYGLINNQSYGHQYWLKIIYRRKSDHKQELQRNFSEEFIRTCQPPSRKSYGI